MFVFEGEKIVKAQSQVKWCIKRKILKMQGRKYQGGAARFLGNGYYLYKEGSIISSGSGEEKSFVSLVIYQDAL